MKGIDSVGAAVWQWSGGVVGVTDGTGLTHLCTVYCGAMGIKEGGCDSGLVRWQRAGSPLYCGATGINSGYGSVKMVW